MKKRNKLLLMLGITILALPAIDNVSGQEQNENIRVDDPSFERQNLQTDETIDPIGNLTIIVIQGLGAILIVLFIVIYAVKKRAKGDIHDKN